jgi:hypothetical protein
MSSRSEALLDHIADFLKIISNTQSFWFTLDTSYNHGCHLDLNIVDDDRPSVAVTSPLRIPLP